MSSFIKMKHGRTVAYKNSKKTMPRDRYVFYYLLTYMSPHYGGFFVLLR